MAIHLVNGGMMEGWNYGILGCIEMFFLIQNHYFNIP